MKCIKHLILYVMAVALAMSMVSCKYVTDAQISAFEKSLEKLEKSYKDLTPSELEKALSLCEKQHDALLNTDNELTPNQKKKIAKLTGRYHRLLIKIEIYYATEELFDGNSILEYIRGLILGNNAAVSL